MGCRPEMRIAIDYEYDRFTHPLPRTVLTVSKRDVLTFEARHPFVTSLGRFITSVTQIYPQRCFLIGTFIPPKVKTHG
jgi:hypothetical protein